MNEGTGRLRDGAVVALALCAAGALGACSSLLDLDVVYTSADAGPVAMGGDASPGGPDAGASGDDASVDGATSDASGAADGGPGLDGASGGDAADAGDAGHATIAYEQGGFANGTDTTVAAAFAQDVLGDAAIIVCLEATTDAPMQVTDTLGNTFKRATFVAATNDNGYRGEIWYALHSPAGPDTITAKAPSLASIDYLAAYIHEYSGVGAFEAASSAFGPAGVTDMESGAIVTTVPGELLFGFGITGRATIGDGFTERRTDSDDLTEDRIVDAPGAVQAAAVADGSYPWAMLGAAFRPK